MDYSRNVGGADRVPRRPTDESRHGGDRGVRTVAERRDGVLWGNALFGVDTTASESPDEER